MISLCNLGLHSWAGCKCDRCGKQRDSHHDWSRSKCKCRLCGAVRESQHDWSNSKCKCKLCGTIRESQHDWTKDCCVCASCSSKRAVNHTYKGLKCTTCGKSRLPSDKSPMKSISLYELIGDRPLAATTSTALSFAGISGPVRLIDLIYQQERKLVLHNVRIQGSIIRIPEDFLDLEIIRVSIPDAERQYGRHRDDPTELWVGDK